MGEVYCIVKEEMIEEMVCLIKLCDCLYNGFKDIEEVYVNGLMELGKCVGLNLNISFNFVEGELLMMVLCDIVVLFGLVCIFVSLEFFYVLCVIGCDDELVYSLICFILGCWIMEEEIDYIIELVKKVIVKLCDFFLFWEMFKEGVDLSKIEWNYY